VRRFSSSGWKIDEPLSGLRGSLSPSLSLSLATYQVKAREAEGWQ